MRTSACDIRPSLVNHTFVWAHCAGGVAPITRPGTGSLPQIEGDHPMSASKWLSGWARIKPDHPAVIFENRAVTWCELDERASRVANVLIGCRVRPRRRA